MNVFLYSSFDPVAFSLGSFKIHWYGISYAVGIYLAWQYCLWLIRKVPLNITSKELSDYIPWAILGIIAGGRLGIALFYNFDYYRHHLAEILYIWRPGMSFHGGLLGVLLTTAWYCHSRKLSFLKFTDLLAAGTPIGLFFGRCANFINGELVGRPTDVAWSVVFPHIDQLPRHASQIYEAILEGFVLFFVLAYFALKTNLMKQRSGFMGGVFLVGYGSARIFVEFFREPDRQIGYLIGDTTLGQWLSLPLVFIGLMLIIRSLYTHKPHISYDGL
ncbi:MAG: prolipoprotein diacylglyceryl transferase [Janthinobacterium lividum]